MIVFTGHDTPEAQEQAMKAGVVAYFQKRVDGEALLSAIACAISDKREISGKEQDPGRS